RGGHDACRSDLQALERRCRRNPRRPERLCRGGRPHGCRCRRRDSAPPPAALSGPARRCGELKARSMRRIEYVQLMASLPALGPILAAKRAPINRIRLLARLQGMLRPEHFAEIEAAASILAWPEQAMLTS